MITKTLKSAALIAALSTAVIGCSVARDQQSAGEYASDSKITSEVKGKYGFDSGVSATAISVETMQGIVQLSGFATSAEEKARAEQIAKDTKGVKQVRNNIVVRPPTR